MQMNPDFNALSERLGVEIISNSCPSHKIGQEEILVLGDSHASIFGHWLFNVVFESYSFIILPVGGATASGLANPNSKTQAYKLFFNSLFEFKGKRVILLLGEVDTGFVIWYRAKRYNSDVDTMLIKATSTYTNFIHKLSTMFSPVVLSAPLPTIKDGNNWGEVANARREVTATQLERTQLTLKFNQEIHAFCRSNNFIFIDLDSDCLGSNGIIKPEFLHPNPCDHHYHPDRYADLLCAKLKLVL